MDLEETRTELMRQLKSHPSVNASQVDAFFQRVQLQAFSPGFAMFTADTAFIKDWIEKHYMAEIQQALKELYDVDFLVQIEVDENAAAAPAPAPAPVAVPAPAPAPAPAPVQRVVTTEQAPEPTAEQAESQAKPEGVINWLTFDTFVIGESNRMAYNMAVEVADNPGTSALNPLFIYGRSGVGKTHLMCAIKNYIEEQYPHLRVCYIDTMELVNRYSDAAREESVNKQSYKTFERFFLEQDVLLIDDVQGLQKAPGTLNALFRIFNEMIPKGKQFVFSADRAPKNIDLDERYVSRFTQGATIDIQPPDDETKRNIIISFIQHYRREKNTTLRVADDVLDYIVENSSSNVREIRSAINNVLFAMEKNESHELTKTQVKDLLGNHFLGGGKQRITIDMVQKAVESFYRVDHRELVGPSRARKITQPRQIAIYLCSELTEKTLQGIGKEFGDRDHSTIKHSRDKIDKMARENRDLREELEAIREIIRQNQY